MGCITTTVAYFGDNSGVKSMGGDQQMPDLEVRNLEVTLEGKKLLQNISFDVAAGEFVCIVGPSGAGKTTLLKQLNRLDPGKTAGQILWKGKDIETYDVHELRRTIAYVFQKAVMFPGSTEDNIKMALKYGPKLSEEEIDSTYKRALEVAEITPDILKTPAQNLSGGQQQRIGIARVMMMRPTVLLLDEPTASLDVETSNHFCQTLKKMKGLKGLKDNEAKTYIMVNHSLDEARFLADKVLMLEEGKVVTYQPADEFFNHQENERAKAFIEAEKLK